jgi:hypothetical protein
MSVVIAINKKENMFMQTRDILNLRKLAVVLISGQYVCLNAYIGLSALAQTQTSTKRQFSQSTLSTKHPASPARQNAKNTAINLRRAYHALPMSNQTAARQQQWWINEYRGRQIAQRLKNWKVKREAAAYARHMADPRSPQAIGYRNAALRAQALQSKLPADQRIKISLGPNMRQAGNAPLRQKVVNK